MNINKQRRKKMKEIWSIKKNPHDSFYSIVSNRSDWHIAEELLYNNALTIITHFNEHGPVKISKHGEVQ